MGERIVPALLLSCLAAGCDVFGALPPAEPDTDAGRPPVIPCGEPGSEHAITLGPSFGANFIAVDDEHVYVNAGLPVRIPRRGGDAVDLISGAVQLGPPSRDFAAGGIAVDASHVYYGYHRFIYRVPREGGEQELVATTSFGPHYTGWTGQIALDDEHVYFADSYFGMVGRVPKSGLPPDEQPLELWKEIGSDVRFLALDETHVYWATSDLPRVMRTPKGGGGPVEQIAEISGARGLAVDDVHVYVVQNASLNVYRLPKAGGAVELFYDRMEREVHDVAGGIVVDDERVYWTNGTAGGVVIARKDGTELRTAPSESASGRDVAVHGSEVFFGTGAVTSGIIARVCR